jgi:acetylornithine deacetylase
MTLSGRAAHSAHPELGANACHAAAEWVVLFEKQIASENARRGFDGAEDGITGSVGILQSGNQVNRIPDHAVLEVDLRTPSNVSEAEILATFEAMTRGIESRRSGIRFEREVTQSYPPFQHEATPPFSEVIAPLNQASRQGPTTARYTTNAGFYSAAGIPTVVFGPGSIEQAHTADEWISLEEVEASAKLFQSVLTG